MVESRKISLLQAFWKTNVVVVKVEQDNKMLVARCVGYGNECFHFEVEANSEIGRALAAVGNTAHHLKLEKMPDGVVRLHKLTPVITPKFF